MGADRGAVELVVVDVLQAELGVEPRPARRLARAKRNVIKLGHPAVAVRGKGVPGVHVDAVQVRVRSAPGTEILTGDSDAVVAAKGKLSGQPKRVEFVGRIGRTARGEGRIQPLKLA